MGNAIIGRGGPADNARVGEVRYTMRDTLGEKWALCNGDPNPGGGVPTDLSLENSWTDLEFPLSDVSTNPYSVLFDRNTHTYYVCRVRCENEEDGNMVRRIIEVYKSQSNLSESTMDIVWSSALDYIEEWQEGSYNYCNSKFTITPNGNYIIIMTNGIYTEELTKVYFINTTTWSVKSAGLSEPEDSMTGIGMPSRLICSNNILLGVYFGVYPFESEEYSCCYHKINFSSFVTGGSLSDLGCTYESISSDAIFNPTGFFNNNFARSLNYTYTTLNGFDDFGNAYNYIVGIDHNTDLVHSDVYSCPYNTIYNGSIHCTNYQNDIFCMIDFDYGISEFKSITQNGTISLITAEGCTGISEIYESQFTCLADTDGYGNMNIDTFGVFKFNGKYYAYAQNFDFTKIALLGSTMAENNLLFAEPNSLCLANFENGVIYPDMAWPIVAYVDEGNRLARSQNCLPTYNESYNVFMKVKN